MGLRDWFGGKKRGQGGTGGGSADPREAFVEVCRARLAARLGEDRVARVPGQPMALRIEASWLLHLDNLFLETRDADPERRELLVERLVAMACARPEPVTGWEQASERLLVALRGAMDRGVDSDLAAVEVVPCLRELLVLDDETAIQAVTAGMVQAWGRPLEELLVQARGRLSRRDPGVAPHDAAAGIWTLEAGDEHESSRLLVPGFLASFRDRVEGRPVAVVPSRGQLYVAGDARPEVVERLCELAEREYAASAWPVSCAPYTCDDQGTLRKYLRPGADPVARRVQRAHVVFERTEYTRDQEGLQADQGRDVYVASFGGLQHPQRGVASWSTWTRGVPTLLPRTDLVAVLEGLDARPAIVPWDELARVAGDRLRLEPGLYPHRWRTVGELTDAELEALARASVTRDV